MIIITSQYFFFFHNTCLFLVHYFITQQKSAMGNKQNNHPIAPQSFSCEHPLFTKAIILEGQAGKVIQSTINCQQKQHKLWINKVIDKDGKQKINAQFLMLPLRSSYQSDKQFCSTTGSAKIIYPHFDTILSMQIRRRKENKEYFKEGDLWYLLYALVAAKNSLSQQTDQMGSINPSNIFIQKQTIKIGNIFLSPRQHLPFVQLVNEQIQSSMLFSPQDLYEARKKSISNKNNTHSEAFSIGATVLSAALLNDLQSCYNYKQLQLLDEKYIEKCQEWEQHPKYSDILKSVILNLVDLTPYKRIPIKTLWEFLQNHKNSIKARHQFIITNPPQNIDKIARSLIARKQA